LAAALFWLYRRPQIGKIIVALSLIVVYADLWFFGHPYIHGSLETSLNNPSGWITGLDAAESRIVVEPYMFANGAMATHAANAQGYASIIPATYADVVDRTPPESRCGSVEHAAIPLSNQHLVKLLSVQYIMGAAGPLDVGLPPLQSGLNAYETADYWPRAQVVNRVKLVSSSTEAAELVNRVDFDPTQWAIIEAENLTLSDNVEVRSSAKITSYQPMRVVVEVDAASEGMLVLNDVWYPGWRGTVNGVETTVYRANGAFRAVRVPPGHSTVIFTFESDSLKQGAWASALTWLVVVVATLVAARK
ncbi:MAG: YfhO family protein, partial [Chloroflexota bacterium]